MGRKKNDILLKSAFEETFSDLLRFFFKEADSIFDIARGFEFMDKELSELFPELEKQGGSRFVDMLVKVYAKDGAQKWMLIHLEIQEQHNPQFAKRMYQYFYRIYDRYDVPVTALAVFTGGQKQHPGDGQFVYSFLGTEVTYRYNAYHILDHTADELLAMDNPFALIVLAAQKTLLADKVSDQELGEQRINIARALIQSKRYDGEQIRRFLFFLKTFIFIENPEINGKFDREIELLTGDQNVMGIIEAIKHVTLEEGLEKGIGIGFEKGVEKGIEEGFEKGIAQERERRNRELVTNLLQGTDFDIARIALVAGVTEAYVVEVEGSL